MSQAIPENAVLFPIEGTNKIIFFILNVSLGEMRECHLVDKEGRFPAHEAPRRILTENVSQTDSFKNILEKRTGV